MGAVALVALLAGGPLGMCLAIAYGITHFVKVAKVDAEYAKQGKTPPSHALISRWLDSRAAKGTKPQKPAKYGMWRYAWQRWQAMWQDLAEQHKEVRSQYKTAVASAKAKGQPLPPKPSFKESLMGWKWQIDQLTAPTTSPAPQPAVPSAVPSGPDPAAPRPNAQAAATPTPSKSPDGTPDWAAPRFHPDAPAEVGRILDQHPTKPPAAAVPAAVTPIIRTEGDTMAQPTSSPQQSGEVVGLMSAINYADAVAAAHEAHSTGGGEQYRASLGQAEVGSETIQTAASAQELSEMAGAAWRAHAAKLREQLAAKEAVTSETGKKEFLLAD
jgi:hypothetical protein